MGSKSEDEFNSYTDSYCQSHGLLFQFILNEFLDLASASLRIHEIEEKLTQELQKNFVISNIKSSLSELANCLSEVSGHDFPGLNTHSAKYKTGIINKLRDYCHRFLDRFPEERPTLFRFTQSCNKMQRLVNRCVDHFQQINIKTLSIEQAPRIHRLQTKIQALTSQIKQLSEQLKSTLKHFSEDENVLLFLLLHKDEFERSYSEKFILSFFLDLHPNGLSDADLKVSKRFEERGFKDLLPLIRQKFSQLTV
ncbi:MAG: hypothetical protein CMO81_03900 [Waddliaceae bacterium]|nr:hypothetical protein [Waddliaceae bacterium]